MNSIYDCYTLSDGNKIPCLGYGTWRNNDYDALRMAIDAGYRYFDTASLYESERPLGAALKDSGVDRSEFFIASKVWIDEMGYEETLEAFKRSLERLQTDYLDLYLIHWPKRSACDPDWKEIDRETWQALEELKEKGLVKSIGLSNFLPHHIENILSSCKVRPAVDQLELHPGCTQEAAVRYAQEQGIIVQAWGSLGRGKGALSKPAIVYLAEKYGKSPAQIALRYLLQRGIIPIVKSANPERMRENMHIFDFELEMDDMYLISCMPQDMWLGEHPDFVVPKKACSRDQ